MEAIGTRPTVQEIRAAAKAEADCYGNADKWDDFGSRVPPDQDYYEFLEAWLGVYDPRALPIARDSMMQLSLEYQRYLRGTSPTPGLDFWMAREQAQLACFKEPPARKRRQTPAEMAKAKVHLRQICWEWRIVTPEGQPDLKACQRELDNPGSVLTEDFQKKLDEQDLVDLGFLLPQDFDMGDWERPEFVKQYDDLESMILERMPLDQIVRLKAEQYATASDPTSETMWRTCTSAISRLMGVELPSNAQDGLNQAGHDTIVAAMGEQLAAGTDLHRQPPMEPVEADLGGASARLADDQLAAEVMRLFNDGAEVKQIADSVHISRNKVKRIIDEHAGK